MIVSRTPLRMSFVGGGSDLPSYYRQKGGAVLSTSIDKYIYVTVNKKFDSDIRLSYSLTENESSAKQIKHPIVRNALSFLGIERGIEITSISDIPSHGSGLGSSSSYTVALLHALYSYQGKSISKEELGRLSSYIEIDLCGDNIGKQDQYAASFGGLNLIKFNEDDSVEVSPIICKPETILRMEESILVFYTGRTRSASSLLNDLSENMKRPRKRALMSDMVSIAYEMKDLLENNDVDFVGELLDKNWKLKRQMTLGISDAQIDDLYNKGILAGATGGKLLGAGNGGFIMFFAPKEKHVNITKAMKNLKSIPFSFEGGGSKIVFSD
jgi:D-glycero-alpha-D-manno-heptose-7-phosphate kinase|tara:strand:- start:749 stop:1726 length:978 start_codon:yes stop_codon:yes gene_type:complete